MKDQRLLFLDFDGVLHPNGSAMADCFCLLPALLDTIAPFEVNVVISSSWRHHRSMRFLKSLFPRPFRKRVVGTTGVASPGPYARWEEIRSYLSEHRATSWRALDDFDFEFPAACPQLIYCNGNRGCQRQELEHIAIWLRQDSV